MNGGGNREWLGGGVDVGMYGVGRGTLFGVDRSAEPMHLRRWIFTIERTPFDDLPLAEMLYYGRLYRNRAARKRRRMRR